MPEGSTTQPWRWTQGPISSSPTPLVGATCAAMRRNMPDVAVGGGRLVINTAPGDGARTGITTRHPGRSGDEPCENEQEDLEESQRKTTHGADRRH